MATFGRYEVVRELSRTPFGSVYSARPAGTQADPQFIIKTFTPPTMVGAEDVARAEVQHFLEQARLQQKVAQSATHWAPVHDLGKSADGVFYVSTFYPSSCLRLVKGKVKLTDGDLYAIVSAIADGLNEFRAACAQPHGNLKPATVLLPKRGELAYGEAVLAEPLLPAEAAAAGERADIQALGDLIFQLVTHRPFNALGGWPVQDAPEWSRLGRRGAGWREFCNKLLDPEGKHGLTVAALPAAIAQLKPARQLVSVPKLAAAVLAVVLLAGAGYAVYQHYSPSLRYTKEDWTTLCQAYDGWLRALDDENYDFVRAKASQDPDLRNAFLAVQKARAKTSFDPKKILGSDQYSYDEIHEHPPDSADGRRQARLAADAIPEIRKSFENWQAYQTARQCRDTFEKQNWKLVAAALSKHLDAATLNSTDVDAFAEAVVKLIDLQPKLREVTTQLQAINDAQQVFTSSPVGAELFKDLPERVRSTINDGIPSGPSTPEKLHERLNSAVNLLTAMQRDWTALHPRIKDVTDPDDQILRQLPAHLYESLVAGVPASDAEALPKLAAGLTKLADDFAKPPWANLAPLAAEWTGGNIDKIEFRSNSPYQGFSADTAERYLAAWAVEAPKYRKIAEPDPRLAIDARRKDLDDAWKRLIDDYPNVADRPPEAATLAAAIARFTADVQKLQQPRWLQGNREQIVTSALAATKDLNKLLADIDAATVVRPEALDAFLTEVRGVGPTLTHPLVSAQWKSLEQGWLKDELTWRQNPKSLRPPVFRALKDQVSRAREHLATIANLPAGIEIQGTPPKSLEPLAQELQKSAAARRDEVIKAGLTNSTWNPQAAFKSPQEWTRASAAYLTWRKDAVALLSELALTEDLLNTGYGPEAKSPVADAVGRARKLSTWSDAVPQLAAAIFTRLSNIEKINGSTDRAAILATASTSNDPAIAVAAWRRLHAQSWPGTLDELRQELQVQEHVAKQIKAPALAAARPHAQAFSAAFRAERTVKARDAWRRFVEEVDHGEQSREAIDAAIADMARYGIQYPPPAELTLSDNTLFNLALHQFRARIRPLKPKDDDEKARQLLASFKALLPRSFQQRQDTQQWLARLDESAKDANNTNIGAAQDGPPASRVKGVTWDFRQDPSDTLRTYTWRNHSLHFVRLAQKPGVAAPPVFLCTTEMPIALIKDLLEVGFLGMDPQKRPTAVGVSVTPPDTGPRAWKARRGLTYNDAWLVVRSPFLINKIYAPGVGRNDRLLAGEPTLDMPMQYLPPDAAMYIAHLLGCRLPTSAEHEIARTMRPKDGPPDNLRDPTWQRQRDHLIATIAELRPESRQVASDQAPWPDAGAYVPYGVTVPTGPKATAWPGASDDNTIWFRPVVAEITLQEVIGNVAEYVWDDPALLEQATPKDLPGFRKLIDQNFGGRLAVTGASAISAPELKDQRHPIVNIRNADDGFADVGFRLAFTVPSRTAVDRIRIVLDTQRYLTASSSAAAAATNVSAAQPRTPQN